MRLFFLNAGKVVAGSAVHFRNERPSLLDHFSFRLRPGFEIGGLSGIARLVVEQVGRNVDGFLLVEWEVRHTAIGSIF